MNEKDLKLMVEQLVSQMVGQVDMQSVEKVVKEVSKINLKWKVMNLYQILQR